MHNFGETNKLFVFASIVVGALLTSYAAYTLAKLQLSVVGG